MSTTIELLKSRLLGVDNRLLEDELYKMAFDVAPNFYPA